MSFAINEHTSNLLLTVIAHEWYALMSLLNHKLKNDLQVMANYFWVLLETCRAVVALHMRVS